MDERNNKPVPQLIEVEPMQDGYRWVAITAMLLAIGIILHTVSPNVGGVTPNWTIAMYSIVINLTRPKLSQAIGIGFIAGLFRPPNRLSRWATLPASWPVRLFAAFWLRLCSKQVSANGSCVLLSPALLPR